MRVFSTEKIIEEITNWPEAKRKAVKFARLENIDGNDRVFAVYPKGTEFFGKQADQLVALGRAKIVDDTPKDETAEVSE